MMATNGCVFSSLRHAIREIIDDIKQVSRQGKEINRDVRKVFLLDDTICRSVIQDYVERKVSLVV